MSDSTEYRKRDHYEICSERNVEYREKTTLLEEVEIIHEALPGIDLDAVDTSAEILGRRLDAPLMVSALSGGIRRADELNLALAELARELGLGLGLGSLRPLLEGGASWPAIRQGRDDPLLILANIGVAQARTVDPARLSDLVDRVGADALCVHLNPAQEWFQAGGDRDFRGGLESIGTLAGSLTVPLVVKETGCGISSSTAARLKEAGVRHLDVAGAGGTSWVRVELERNGGPSEWARPFREWGIPTAASLLAAAGQGFETLIASGGVRSGLDAAKTVAMGADAAGVALPVLRAWKDGAGAVRGYLAGLKDGFRTALALAGAPNTKALENRYVVTGRALRSWIDSMERAAGMRGDHD